MAGVEERLAGLEGVIGQMSIRLERLEKQMDERFAAIERRFERLEDEIKHMRGDFETNFRWLVGILLTMWATITLTVLFK